MYKSGKKEGNYFEFHEDGRLDYYNYFVKDQVVYIKDYQYGLNDSIKFEEGFIPILSFEQNSDTIFCKERLLNFDISIFNLFHKESRRNRGIILWSLF